FRRFERGRGRRVYTHLGNPGLEIGPDRRCVAPATAIAGRVFGWGHATRRRCDDGRRARDGEGPARGARVPPRDLAGGLLPLAGDRPRRVRPHRALEPPDLPRLVGPRQGRRGLALPHGRGGARVDRVLRGRAPPAAAVAAGARRGGERGDQRLVDVARGGG